MKKGLVIIEFEQLTEHATEILKRVDFALQLKSIGVRLNVLFPEARYWYYIQNNLHPDLCTVNTFCMRYLHVFPFCPRCRLST